MSAGRKSDLIALWRYTGTEDGLGQDDEDWAEIGRAWAQIFWGRGDERRQAAMEQGQQPATFQIYLNSLTETLTIRDRIEFGGVWDITALALNVPKRGEMEITAVRAQ